MKTEDVLVVDDIHKSYADQAKGIQVIRGVSFSVKRGERIAIMGKSGSGKSTILNMIGCLDIPTSGKIYIDGIDTSKMSPGELARLRLEKIGFVFQQFHLIPTLTALQNVALPMMLKQMDKDEREKRAAEILETLGLGHRLNQLPTKLSGGEKQRAAIARSLANDPAIIMADEPTGNLDSKAGEEVVKIFERLHKKEKKTLIVVTHDPDLAELSERVVYIVDGKIEKIRSPRKGH